MYEAALPFPNIDPVLIHLGPLAIRWYALAYIAGLLIGWWYMLKLARDSKLWAGPPFGGKAPATEDQLSDLLVWITLGVIFGGRLGYVLLYGTIYCGIWGSDPSAYACDGLPAAYLEHPIKIIAAWEGGMSFHGGLAGVVVAMFLYCRRHKLRLMPVADLVAAATPIGLFFGRIANFVNGELWGKPSDAPWAVVFPNPLAGGVPRHPSQIYEALMEGALLFIILRIAMVRFGAHKRPGLVIAIFLTGYGFFRFVAEFFRDSESKLWGWFSMGQALSLPMWAAAAFFFWYAYRSQTASRMS
jgi:phosphatidylglycerol:prolipoprotein diacylglycerol transferase